MIFKKKCSKSISFLLVFAMIIANLFSFGSVRAESSEVANLVNNSPIIPGEVVFGNQVTGMKGFFAKVTLKNDATTDISGPKSLFSVGSEYMNR